MPLPQINSEQRNRALFTQHPTWLDDFREPTLNAPFKAKHLKAHSPKRKPERLRHAMHSNMKWNQWNGKIHTKYELCRNLLRSALWRCCNRIHEKHQKNKSQQLNMKERSENLWICASPKRILCCVMCVNKQAVKALMIYYIEWESQKHVVANFHINVDVLFTLMCESATPWFWAWISATSRQFWRK